MGVNLISRYVFGDVDLIEQQRVRMQQCMDPITTERLETLGVGPGWRCLEVGGGGGSITRWLSERVGESGHVLATELDTAELHETHNVSVREHNIVTDELPEDEFDLVHARLVLLHLPERHRALARMVRALRPGGWLLLGEFDNTWMPVLAAPDEAAATAFRKFHSTLCHLLVEAGAHLEWGSHAYQAMRDQGLVELNSRAEAHPWHGGSPGGRWLYTNTLQLQDKMLATNLISQTELEKARELLRADPNFVVSSYFTISTWGRKPLP